MAKKEIGAKKAGEENKGSHPAVPGPKKSFADAYLEANGVLVHAAKIMGLSYDALKKRVSRSEALQRERTAIDREIDGNIQGRLYNIAMGRETGHPTSAIFWLKARAGWRDRSEVHHTGSVDFGEPPKEDSAKQDRPGLVMINGGAPVTPTPGSDDDGTT